MPRRKRRCCSSGEHRAEMATEDARFLRRVNWLLDACFAAVSPSLTARKIHGHDRGLADVSWALAFWRECARHQRPTASLRHPTADARGAEFATLQPYLR